MFTVSNYVSYFVRHVSIYYILISVVIAIMSTYILKNYLKGFLVGYSFLVFAETILMRGSSEGYDYRLKLFWSYSHPEEKVQIILNILMFIPIGILGWLVFKKWVFVYSIGFSLFIETLQLITKRGIFEFDDIFHNMLGATVGIILCAILSKLINRREL